METRENEEKTMESMKQEEVIMSQAVQRINTLQSKSEMIDLKLPP